MNKYIYDGPIKEFERVICKRWRGETMAVSERKARSNLIYQFKVKHGRMPGSRISLPGEIKCIDMKGWEYDE